MSRHLIGAILVTTITLFCAPLEAQTACSTRGLVGIWAATSQGTVLPTENPKPTSGPGAAVGLVMIDYNGRISINLSGNIGGGVAPLVATGKVTVNPDCTGTFSAQTPPGWSLTENFVVLNEGNEIRTIAVEPYFNTQKPVVWQCRWKRLSRVPVSGGLSACSDQMTRGTWVGSFAGALLTSPEDPPAQAGILTRGVVDHRKELRGQYTASIGGQISEGEYSGLVVEVNSDCTGRWSYALTGADGNELPGKIVEDFVIVDHGEEIWAMPVQGVFGMPVGLTRYERISSVPFE